MLRKDTAFCCLEQHVVGKVAVSSAGVTALIFAVYRELLATAGFFLLAWVSSALKAAGLGDRPYIPRREDWYSHGAQTVASIVLLPTFLLGGGS